MHSGKAGHTYPDITLTLRRVDPGSKSGTHTSRQQGRPGRLLPKNSGVIVERSIVCRSSLLRDSQECYDDFSEQSEGCLLSTAKTDGVVFPEGDVGVVGFLAHEVLDAVGLYRTRDMRRVHRSPRRLSNCLSRTAARMGFDIDVCFPRSHIRISESSSGRKDANTPFSRILPLEHVPRFLTRLSGDAAVLNNPILMVNDLVNQTSTEYMRWQHDSSLHRSHMNLCANWRTEMDYLNQIRCTVSDIGDTLGDLHKSYDKLTTSAAEMHVQTQEMRRTLKRCRKENTQLKKDIRRLRKRRRSDPEHDSLRKR